MSSSDFSISYNTLYSTQILKSSMNTWFAINDCSQTCCLGVCNEGSCFTTVAQYRFFYLSTTGRLILKKITQCWLVVFMFLSNGKPSNEAEQKSVKNMSRVG